MAYFHSNNFSTHENQCGSCARMEVNNNSFHWYCTKHKMSFEIKSSKCSSYEKDNSRDYDFWRDIYTYHVSTAICQILDFDINSNLFQSIKTLRDEMAKYEKYNGLLKLYDIVGPYIADRLHNDQNNKYICTCLVNKYFPKIVILINENNLIEAIKEYSTLIEKLYRYYQNIDSQVNMINEINCFDNVGKTLKYNFLENR